MKQFLRRLAAPTPRAAILGVSYLPVRPQHRLRLRAPERPSLHRRFAVAVFVVVGLVVQRLRPQAATHFARCDHRVELGHGYALPACSSARFTATRASCTLYLFPLNGLAPRTAASPALAAFSSVSALPLRNSSAAVARQGMGATCPSTIRAEVTVLPLIFS